MSESKHISEWPKDLLEQSNRYRKALEEIARIVCTHHDQCDAVEEVGDIATKALEDE